AANTSGMGALTAHRPGTARRLYCDLCGRIRFGDRVGDAVPSGSMEGGENLTYHQATLQLRRSAIGQRLDANLVELAHSLFWTNNEEWRPSNASQVGIRGAGGGTFSNCTRTRSCGGRPIHR